MERLNSYLRLRRRLGYLAILPLILLELADLAGAVSDHQLVDVRVHLFAVAATLLGLALAAAVGRRWQGIEVDLVANDLELLARRDSDASVVAQRTAIRARVDALLERNDFHVVHQPIVGLLDGEIVGFEALARFPSGRPDKWFSAARSVGRGPALELAALRHAMAFLSSLSADRYVSMNLSPSTLIDPNFYALIRDVSLRQVVFELTEHVELDDDYGAYLAAITAIRARGGRIAVDDAGSGYASLRNVVHLEPDIIKIDRDLIADIDISDIRFHLITAMVLFADQCGSVLIAEGVETHGEAAALIAAGVEFAQGWLLGRPTRPGPSGLPAPIQPGACDDRDVI